MNLETVERIVAILEEFPLAEIEVSTSGSRIAVKRGAPMALPPASPFSLDPADTTSLNNGESGDSENIPGEDSGILVEIEIVGIFHHAHPPLRVGSIVSEGQSLGHVEAMKLRHDIASPVSGRIAEVLLEDGRGVEYGTVVFRIVPE